jgi:curved DNA-binding protein CbpA
MNIRQSLQILELSPTYTEKELTTSYRKLARKWHPDVNKTPEATDKFKEIQQAYDILKDNKDYSRSFSSSGSSSGILFDIFSNINGNNVFWSRFVRDPSQGLLMQLEFEDLSEEDSEKIIQILEKEGIKVKSYSMITGSASYVRK